MKKKFSCMLLAFVMMLAAVPLLELPAFAEESVNLQTKVAKGNGQVTVTVSADGELDADALSFEIQYDEDAFELLEPVGVCTTCKYDFGETTTISGGKVYRASPYECSWTNLEKAKDDDGKPSVVDGFQVKKPYQGDLFKLVFNIKSDAAVGTYSFTPVNAECSVLEITTGDNPVAKETNPTVAINAVSIELKESDIPKGLLGDVNTDGVVTAADLTLLARHVAKIEVITDPVALLNADVTGDGSVSAEDLTKLARYIAKIIQTLE